MIRVGHGYDVHRLVYDGSRKMILGGIDIPCEMGLLGHSDADVLTHAVMDSLLGALALGDIGKHFPDTDEKYSGADSCALLSYVCELVAQRGWRIENFDATVLAQKPKLSPYIEQMRLKLSEVMGIDADCASVKATTEEGLGFTGEGLGIAAHCVVLLTKTEG